MAGFGALELLARAGFLVKGVVYIVVGALALQVAAQLGGRVRGTRDARVADAERAAMWSLECELIVAGRQRII